MATNTSSPQQEANFLEQDEEDNEVRVPESNGQDTGTYGTSPTEHNAQYQGELETIPEEEEEEEDPQMAEKQEVDDPDMVAYTPDDSKEESFNTAIDDTSEDPTIVMGKLVTTAFISDDVHIPTEKVGCLQVTSQLQEFLNHFPPESKEKAFEQIYQILQTLDLTMLKTMFLQRYNPWGKTKREQLQSWNILSFDPKNTDVDEHVDLINTLGDMVDQKEEAKMEKVYRNNAYDDTNTFNYMQRLGCCKRYSEISQTHNTKM